MTCVCTCIRGRACMLTSHSEGFTRVYDGECCAEACYDGEPSRERVSDQFEHV
eukprot:m.381232 g.381232  ORF g.381232 m.381232 type:complete len:53 (+) comp110563_c0_seq1:46-204(+)